MARKVLWTFLGFLISVTHASAQCCSAGNPYFYSEQTNMGHKEIQVLTGYKYSTSGTYYTGSEEIEINDIEKAWFNYLTLQLVYGITSRLSVQSDLGYYLNKSEDYYKEDWTTKTGYGLGDLNVTLKYLAYKNFKKKYSIIPSIGMKFPVGVFDQEVNNVKLPITIQPSSGSFRYQLNLYFNKSFKNPKWNLGFYGSYEYAQLIDSENFYYKYGNIYLFSIIGSYKVLDKINLGFEIRNENRAKASRENEQVVKSSGYTIIYSIPHISFSLTEKWIISANAEFPVYKYYNGIQLGNKFAISARLSYQINFKKSLSDDVKLN